MSTRERWIVYPLLFLALGTALRDKFWDSTGRALLQRIGQGHLRPAGIGPIGVPGVDRQGTKRPAGGRCRRGCQVEQWRH